MSINNESHNLSITSALDAVQKLQENGVWAAIHELQASSAVTATLKAETTGIFAAVREMQSTLNAVKLSMSGATGATAALEEYKRLVTPISESIKAMNSAYAPIFEQTRAFDTLNIKEIASGVQTSASAMSAISGLNLSGIASIIDNLPKYDFLSDMVADDFSVDFAGKLYEHGEITQDDINEEISEIVRTKQFSPKNEWDKQKKSKWFIAIKILIIIVTFVCNPVMEHVVDKALDSLGITEFWEKSGVYDLIELIFEGAEESVVSEAEAKATVDESKIGNISRQRREDMISKIKEIRTFVSAAPQDENTEKLLVYLAELEKDVCGKKYGLVFEEHREEIDEVLNTHTPMLTEEKALFIDNGGQMNFLIEGDNLASLKLLEKTHRGKIDLIYIDPPYNTGNKDFVYDDCFVNSDDLFSHSKWISFMSVRLDIAKNLLSNEGIIFLSIGDTELADLKLLCDEIFGEMNCLSIVPRLMKTGGNKGRFFSPNIDYVLVYAKNQFSAKDFKGELEEETVKKLYNKVEKEGVRKGERYRPFGLYQSSLDERPNQRYYIECPDGTYVIPPGKTMPNTIADGEKVLPNKGDGCWRWSQERYLLEKANGNILFIQSKGGVLIQPDGSKSKWNVYTKIWLSNRENEGQTPTNFIGKYENRHSAKELKDIGVSFDFAKPTGLITYLFNLTGAGKDAVCLDFFAGSGTTAHAVMKLNAEDGGNRRFILCTNNENNICRDITYERINRVIDKENYEASLKYYKVDYVPTNERMYYEYADELLKHIRELVELENGINFAGNKEIGIALTEEEFDNFILQLANNTNCRKLYLGYDILMDAQQAQLLKDRKIAVNIIPDYYYKELEG